MGNTYRVHLAGALAAIVWVGSAQAQTTTTCIPIGYGVQCRSTAPAGGGIDPTIPLQIKGFTLGDLLNEQQQRQERQQAMQIQQQEHFARVQADDQARSDREMAQMQAQLTQDVREAVGDYLRKGQCQEATAFALKYGEIELATQARQFCAAGPSPSPKP